MSGIVLSKQDREKILRRKTDTFGRDIVEALCSTINALESAVARAKDDPEADGTDWAHPAWWRGQEQGVHGVVRALTKIANEGKHAGVFGNAAVEALAVSIAELREKAWKYDGLCD